MICGRLNDEDLIRSLSPRFQQALGWLRDRIGNLPETGEEEIDGRALYAMVQRYETMPETIPGWEGHRQYADIHLIVHGQETDLWAPLSAYAGSSTYDETLDLLRCTPEQSLPLALREGWFAVFFPEDLHKPKCHLSGPHQVVKCLIKVRLDAQE